MITESRKEAQPMDLMFNIEKNLGTLSESSKGWAKEVNMVSWNEREAKLDIRDWSPNHEKMGKGITLSNAEAQILYNVLKEYLGE